MKELLDFQEKQLVRETFKDHILYKLVNQSCKRYEVEMPHLKFSPEEIFLSVILRLEELRDNPDGATSYIHRLWDELICRYREREGEIPDEEVDLAVRTVMCFLCICLNSQAEAELITWTGELASVIAEHDYPKSDKMLDIMMFDIRNIEKGEEELAEWVSGYLEDTKCLSKKIEVILSGKEDLSASKEDTPEFPLDTVQCVILYSYLLGEGVACHDTNATKLADFIGQITPYNPSSVRTVIGRIKKMKCYKGKIVQDALKVSEILKPFKPQIANDIEETFAP